MKKIAFAAAVLALGTVSASAADMAARYTKAPVAVAAVYNWTGFYIGADVGYGWGRSTGTLTNAAGLFPVNYSLDPSGVLGGGFVGFNYQVSNVVLGIEADWQAADLNQSGNFLFGGVPTYAYRNQASRTTVRSAAGSVLPSTAGWCSARAVSRGVTGTPRMGLSARLPSSLLMSARMHGWTAGAGVEYAFADNWLGRVEYRYTDLGRAGFVSAATNQLGARKPGHDQRRSRGHRLQVRWPRPGRRKVLILANYR